MGFNISNAMSGVGSAVSEVAGEYAKTAIAKNAKLDLMKVEAEIAAQRDARLNDYAVTMEKDVRQPFQTGERVATQDFQSTEKGKDRDATAALQTERLAVDKLFHGDRMEIDRGRLKLDEKRVGLDEKRLGMEGARLANDSARLSLEREVKDLQIRAGNLDLEGKERLNALQKEYAAPGTTPERKSAIAESLYTLLGKDKFVPVTGKNDDGTATFSAMDTRTGDFKAQGGGATAGGVAKPKTQAEFDALPPGARFINPSDGKEMVKRDAATENKAPKAKGAEAASGSSSGIPLVSEPVDRMAAGRGSAVTISPDSMRQRGIVARQMAEEERRRAYGDAGY